jgi:hypothetical protein
VKKILALVCATAGSAIGWWIGDKVGLMTAFFLSLVGTAVGIYVSNLLARRYIP